MITLLDRKDSVKVKNLMTGRVSWENMSNCIRLHTIMQQESESKEVVYSRSYEGFPARKSHLLAVAYLVKYKLHDHLERYIIKISLLDKNKIIK